MCDVISHGCDFSHACVMCDPPYRGSHFTRVSHGKEVM